MSSQRGCATLSFSFDGLNMQTGPVSVPGLNVGDIVLAGTWNGQSISVAQFFESTVSVADQIQQLDGADNLTGIVLIIARPA